MAEKTGYYHFESSKVIEHCFATEKPEKTFDIDGKKYTVADEKKIWTEGTLNSPAFVVHLMVQKIKELAKDEKSIIFSGSPRTIYEAEKEIPLLIELYGIENLTFLMLQISAETTMFRNSHRRICQLIRHSILFSPETEKLTKCPLDGSDLVTRKGLDTPETIVHRLQEFTERTRPVTEVMEKFGVKINLVNGEQSVADVHKDVLKTLNIL